MSAAKRGERPDLYAFDRALLKAGEREEARRFLGHDLLRGVDFPQNQGI